jgi:4-aminobutyrate aminotransferase/(S)-3-amino-2-methylpropionate transaminase
LISQWKTEKGKDVVAIVMEPIMAEGGDTQISGYFANQIRSLTKEMGIYMIVDEVQTGVITTGAFWAHEHWNLTSPPDMMTFAKKM